MKLYTNKNLLLSLITILIMASSIKSDVYQLIVHKGYVMATASTTDYHKLDIKYSGTAAPTEPTTDFKYYIQRKILSNAITETTQKSLNDNTLNERYRNYLMDINGILSTKNYVAYDIVATCESSNLTATNIKVKYFNSEYAASDFYDTLASDNNKAFFNQYGLVKDTPIANPTLPLTLTDRNGKIIAQDQTTINLC